MEWRAGDEFAGTSWDVIFQGAQNVPVLEEVGVDVMAVGNHEFDYGACPLRLLGLMHLMHFHLQ